MCAELLDKHLDLQKKGVWTESVGIMQKGLLRNSCTVLPLTSPVKGKHASLWFPTLHHAWPPLSWCCAQSGCRRELQTQAFSALEYIMSSKTYSNDVGCAYSALPCARLVAMVEGWPLATADAMLTIKGPAPLANTFCHDRLSLPHHWLCRVCSALDMHRGYGCVTAVRNSRCHADHQGAV